MLELIGLALALVVGVAALGAFLYKDGSNGDKYALRAIRKDGRMVTWQDDEDAWDR